MARVLYGQGVEQFRGKISGTVFQTTQSGNIARARVMPRRRLSSSSSKSRSLLALINRRWKTLAAPYHADWNTFADNHNLPSINGALRVLTGYECHQSINSLLYYVGNYIEEPPVYDTLQGFNFPTFTVTPSKFQIPYTWSGPVDNVYIYTYTTPQSTYNPGSTASNNILLDVRPIEASATLNLIDNWIAHFGSIPSPGMKLYARVFPIHDGTGIHGQQRASIVTIKSD